MTNEALWALEQQRRQTKKSVRLRTATHTYKRCPTCKQTVFEKDAVPGDFYMVGAVQHSDGLVEAKVHVDSDDHGPTHSVRDDQGVVPRGAERPLHRGAVGGADAMTCECCRRTVRPGELVLPIMRALGRYSVLSPGVVEPAPTGSFIHVRCLLDLTLDRIATPALRANLHDFVQREGP